ncbi:MAG: amidase [Pseudomonadota bacterium]
MKWEAPSAEAIALKIAGGAVSARDVTAACLDRIAAREAEVHAFAFLDPAHALRQADALDAHRKAGRPIGPLHGLPVALKDIVDTADMPTENGTPLDAGRRPRKDATITARLRAAGAVILGKTVTTELAFQCPGPTRNPHNLAHTPGGSSQGSAAAVADGMVPLSIGSQTVGSTIRPAAFCGIYAMKPTHGAISLAGVLSTSEPLDTCGTFAATLEDIALLTGALIGFDPADPRTRPMAAADLLAAVRANPPMTPLLAFIGGPFWADVSDGTKGLFEELRALLGDRVDDVALPGIYENAFAAHQTIMKASFAKNLRPYRERGGDTLSTNMREAMDEGAEIRATDYLAALDWQKVLTAGLGEIFDRYDAILMPAAMGEAPEGFASTGDSRCNALATFLGAPAIAIPAGRGSNGLPLGVQLIGRPGEDGRLLRTAAWLDARLKAA